MNPNAKAKVSATIQNQPLGSAPDAMAKNLPNRNKPSVVKNTNVNLNLSIHILKLVPSFLPMALQQVLGERLSCDYYQTCANSL